MCRIVESGCMLANDGRSVANGCVTSGGNLVEDERLCNVRRRMVSASSNALFV